MAKAVRPCRGLHRLRKLLSGKGFATGSRRGRLRPGDRRSEEVLSLIVQAINQAGYVPDVKGGDALDPAATSSTARHLPRRRREPVERRHDRRYEAIIDNSGVELEDGLAEATGTVGCVSPSAS